MVDGLALLIVHAHPDDESICTGGTLARYAAEGIQTVLVCCTAGEGGAIKASELDTPEVRSSLGAFREDEVRTAARLLGVGKVYLLGYHDSALTGFRRNDNGQLVAVTKYDADSRSFAYVDIEEAAERLAVIIRSTRPHVVVVYDEYGGYGHPDHIMAHHVTRLAVEYATSQGDGGRGWSVAKFYYPVVATSLIIWVNEQMRTRGLAPPFRSDYPQFDILQLVVPDSVITARVDVRTFRKQVQQALRAHRTQIIENSVFLSLPGDIDDVMYAEENYIRAFSRVSAPDHETDLFTGLR